MTGQVRRSPVSSTSETPCTSRHLTLVLIQDKGGSSSTAVLPLCPLMQHLSPDTTSSRTTGKSSSAYSMKQQTLFGIHERIIFLRCLTDAKEGGLNTLFQPRTRAYSLQLQLDAFLFHQDSRNTVSHL